MYTTLASLPETDRAALWERMRAGDRYLRAIAGNWRARVNPDTLNLAMSHTCVIGQSVEDFLTFTDCNHYHQFISNLTKMGFIFSSEYNIHHCVATEAWLQYIEETSIIT